MEDSTAWVRCHKSSAEWTHNWVTATVMRCDPDQRYDAQLVQYRENARGLTTVSFDETSFGPFFALGEIQEYVAGFGLLVAKVLHG